MQAVDRIKAAIERAQSELDDVNRSFKSALKEADHKAYKRGKDDGYDSGRSAGYREGVEARRFRFSSDDARVLTPILQEAYDREIAAAPWKARIFLRMIEALDAAE